MNGQIVKMPTMRWVKQGHHLRLQVAQEIVTINGHTIGYKWIDVPVVADNGDGSFSECKDVVTVTPLGAVKVSADECSTVHKSIPQDLHEYCSQCRRSTIECVCAEESSAHGTGE